MKIFKRIVALVILLAALPLSLISCNRRYDEEEVRAAAIKLITASAELNQVYYGEGIRYLENSSNNVSLYCEADPVDLERLGFSTIAELKAKTKEVFSEAHAETMFKGSFSGTFSQSGASNMARYYQKFDDNKANPKPVCIMVLSTYESLLKGDVTYDFDTLKVMGSDGEYINATIEANVIYDGKTQKHTLNIRLIEEDSGWRLASTTFAKYNEYQDIYDELQKG